MHHEDLQSAANQLENLHQNRLNQINSHYIDNQGTLGTIPGSHVVIPYKKTFKDKLMKVLPILLIILGICLFGYKVLAPVIENQLDENERQVIIKPIDNNDDIAVIKNPNYNFSFEELLGTSKSGPLNSSPSLENLPEYFYVSIPKLKIDKARIKLNSTELNPRFALGHYRGSCLPGDACNAFIYGHSTFKSIKNKYETGDYTAVFSHLNELQFGDEFIITYNDTEYKYLVNTMKIESPDKVDPLENPFGKGSNVSSVTLFTCDPPGTTKNRLLIVGVLVK